MHTRRRSTLSALVGVLLAGLTAALVGAPGAVAQSPELPVVKVVLPPGNSQFFSQVAFAQNGVQETAASQGQGTAPDPDSWGPNVDDQRELYWNYEYRDGALRPEPFCDDPQTPRDGVTICFDEFGVPAVYADDNEDLWFGVGYAVAQIRGFLVDAIRRTARGTLSDLAGGDANVQDDVATRITQYSEEEYLAMLNASSPEAVENAVGYRDGFNQWVTEVTTTNRDALPAEYVLLQEDPEPITLADISAIGVLFVRFVAAEGRQEMDNVRALRNFEAAFGVEDGRARFQDLVWQEDPQASVTAHRPFLRTEYADDPAELERVFQNMADYAQTIPLELASGDGTGAFEVPQFSPGPGGISPPPAPGQDTSEDMLDVRGHVTAALDGFRRRLHGGSFLVSIAPEKTADGSALLMSEPQLLMAPQLLLEIEVHGAGYHGRGSTAPGVPVLGIGYNNDLAWALTTGNSKTIDSFIETVRPDSNGDGTDEYFHDGQWKEQECRTETVTWRPSQSGAPVGPAINQVDIDVCRTVHGPIVATSDDGTMARSIQYATWLREVETIEGVGFWAKATTLEEFRDLTSRVSWNENVSYADNDGNIAWWHPGLHHVRSPETDLRLPIPGTGEFDHDGFLPFDQLPHEVNPPEGYIVNWNNKPARGWLDGGGQSATSYPSGPFSRHRTLQDFVAGRDDWTIDGLVTIDKYAGSQDFRSTAFLDLLLDLRSRGDLTDLDRAALDVLAGWDGSANGPGADWTFDFDSTPATVGPAASIFHRTMEELPGVLFGELAAVGEGPADFDLLTRQRSMGRHFYDMSPVLNLAARVLDPSSSGLTPAGDYLAGRSSEDVLLEALRAATGPLASAQGDDPTAWRTDYGRMEEVCASVGGIIGPCPEMPFLERGSWVHLVGYPNAGAAAPAPTPVPTATAQPVPGDTGADGDGGGSGQAGDGGHGGDGQGGSGMTPVTGGGLALGALALLGAAEAVRRRR